MVCVIFTYILNYYDILWDIFTLCVKASDLRKLAGQIQFLICYVATDLGLPQSDATDKQLMENRTQVKYSIW